MDRRRFIKLTAAGSAALLVSGPLAGCAEGPAAALEGWQGPPPDERDIRLRVLAYAILAPNPHNKQPWVVDLTGPESLDLYVDRDRLLPETDPPFRQIHIGQGTFLENLDLAARQLGYRAEIAYFPRGMYANTAVEAKPVAAVRLLADPAAARDPLFDHILTRQSNKRVYDEAPVTAAEIAALEAAFGNPGLRLVITAEAARVDRLAAFMERAMEIETRSPAREAETLAMFRFDDSEIERHRDGFGIAQSGVTGLKRRLAETFFVTRERAEAPGSDFGRQAVRLTADQARSAAAYGWILSETNTRLDQVLAGRAYERLNLAATGLGLAQHPMSQILQEYPDMAGLRRAFLAYLGVPEGHTVQMLFRLGRAEPVPHTPRRRLDAIVRS